jgi:queuosine precursor transporter
MQNYKFLNRIVLWNVFFAVICIPTAGKLIDVMGIPLSISIYYFPFVYIFADILTEVYGYAVARRVLWYCIFAQLLVIAVFEFVILYPPSAVMTNNQSYVDVLSAAPRLVLFGTLAMFAGDIANNYVLAKMKVWTDGRYISARFVTSTLCGQMVNTGRFLHFRSVGDDTDTRINKKHCRCKPYKSRCGDPLFAGNTQSILVAQKNRKCRLLRQRNEL